MKYSALSCVFAGAIMLTACAHKPADTGPIGTAQQQQALDDLQREYDAGDYQEVTRTVGLSVVLQTAVPRIWIPALKLQAFSYCLQHNESRCRASFDRILQRYPSFELAPAESQHPMWGPVFKQAKSDMANDANPTRAGGHSSKS